MEHSLRSVVDWDWSWRLPGRIASPATMRAVWGVTLWLAWVLFMHAVASTIHHGVAIDSSSAKCMLHQ